MSDDSDKTVFKTAGRGSPDHTAMRPMPGGRGATAPQPGAARPASKPQPSSMAPVDDVEAVLFGATQGLNPLVNAASALITVFEKTRQSTSHPNIGGLHKRLVSEIRQFDNRLRELGIKPEIALSARYVLCSVLDETILNTPWGSESPWAQRTLLSVFHNETSGGEKVFLILDRMRQTPADNIHMIELIYICLSLGFEGKYRLNNRGRDAIEVIRDDLFLIIRGYRGEHERSLSAHWQGLGRTKKTLTQYLPIWIIVVIAVCILFFSFVGFRWWLYDSATPLNDKLDDLSITAQEKLAPLETHDQNTVRAIEQ